MPFDDRLLSGIGVLSAIVEAGSFARAAEALGLTASGVSRAVARLETRLGVRLIDRTTRSLALSQEGRRFYENVRPLLESLETAAAEASRGAGEISGRLRVNIDPYFARTVLAGKVTAFLDHHPHLSLDLITRDQIGDLVGDGMDVAVRFGEPANASLIARKLADVPVLTVAAPAYLERRGHPQHPDELAQHDCIQFRDPTSGRPYDWEFRKGRDVVAVKTTGRLMVSDGGVMLGEGLAGGGVIQMLDFEARAWLDSGQLVRLLPEWNGETFPLYALYPSRHHPAARVRAFVDFVREAVA